MIIIWPWDSAETKSIKRIIRKCIHYLVEELEPKGLVSLYLAGTILTKDRTSYSDIDLFGFVSSDFDIIKEEDKVNKRFESLKDNQYGGFEIRFRGIGFDELEGGKPRGIIAEKVGLDSYIHYFPHYRLLWGKRLDFLKFKIKPAKLRTVTERNIDFIEKYIKSYRKGKEIVPTQGLVKYVLALARVEAQKDYGFKFDPSYRKLTRHLAKERDHIAHKAMELRYKKFTKKEFLEFFKEVEVYIKHIKKRLKEWD